MPGAGGERREGGDQRHRAEYDRHAVPGFSQSTAQLDEPGERAQPFEGAQQEQTLEHAQSGRRAREEQKRQCCRGDGERQRPAAQQVRAEGQRGAL